MASEDLLKKAVAAFKALSPEQQAEMLEEQRQSWVRGNVGLSRDERGMTSPVMPRPAPDDLKARDRKRYKLIRKSLQNKGLLPAATDTGLETYEPYLEVIDTGIGSFEEASMRKSSDGSYVHIDQAEELLAAKDERLKDWQNKWAQTDLLRLKAEADNAAKDEAIEALEAKLTAAEKALEKIAGYHPGSFEAAMSPHDASAFLESKKDIISAPDR